jgi:hypothetical protein
MLHCCYIAVHETISIIINEKSETCHATCELKRYSCTILKLCIENSSNNSILFWTSWITSPLAILAAPPTLLSHQWQYLILIEVIGQPKSEPPSPRRARAPLPLPLQVTTDAPSEGIQGGLGGRVSPVTCNKAALHGPKDPTKCPSLHLAL